MQISFIHLLASLAAGITVIIILTTRLRVHAFFALFIACFVVGISVQMPMTQLLNTMKEGFGNIMKSLSLVIILGTALGVLLEHSGSTKVMADFIMKKTGERRAPLAMSITGFVVGLPIFCDSGYIVLSGLAKSLAARTGISMAAIAVSLATGLYSVHCLIPPHPGMSAAAASLHIDFGRLMLAGIPVALPACIIGYIWARYASKKAPYVSIEDKAEEDQQRVLPGVGRAFMPVIIPVVLIALKSFSTTTGDGLLINAVQIFGEPVIALIVGVLLALLNIKGSGKDAITHVLQEAAEKAGGILVIIGAGGAFGAVLAATNPAGHFNALASSGKLGILFPFLVAFILKTAQGSSTVAIITAASLVQPLLPALGLHSPNGSLLAALSMGAGSMMISHANDAYFWVIAKFSGLDMKTMLRTYSVATLLMGLVTLLSVYFLSFILPA